MLKPPSEQVLVLEVTDPGARRLDVYLTTRLPGYSRSQIQHLMAGSCVRLNDRIAKAAMAVHAGDQLTIQLPPPSSGPLISPEPIPLEIIFEDDYYLAVNKPAGLVVHPGAGNRTGTLVNALVHYSRELGQVGEQNRPGLVHRLDKNTSGIVIVARSNSAHWKLSRRFAERQVFKQYLALVWGCPSPPQRRIETPIGRDPHHRQRFAVTETGKPSSSIYRVVQDFGPLALVEIILETGRTHQARVHLNHIGHAVVGDPLSRNGSRLLAHLPPRDRQRLKPVIDQVTRQLLHARCLRFDHPFTQQTIELQAPLPADFTTILEMLRT